ncbi:hypothetical protein DMC47_01610 [Nostoc sp. 3335mG]|nr:hypothetical protein DMC47_01610 [Nostoc sp. 3335mG]
MRHLPACLALGLLSLSPALAFDGSTQAVLDGLKRGKLVPIDAVGSLMMKSERWCYGEQEGACDWSDTYLDLTADGAVFEIGNAWNEQYEIFFTDEGVFEDNRYFCEIDRDWVPTLHAIHRSDGSPVGGRELWALKQEIAAGQARPRVIDCFDYVLAGIDDDGQTVTLLQRQFTDGVTDPANDVEVTLHFDPSSAAALTYSF